MCGIFSYFGAGISSSNLRTALCNLEYRGYDSFGFCSRTNSNNFIRRRAVGSIADNAGFDLADFDDVKNVIAHTRWATHGEVSVTNSHPHVSSDGEVAIVHNGVISNYNELRNKYSLSTLGTTDTEIAVELISFLLKENNSDISKALQEFSKLAKGEYAIVGLLKSSNLSFAIKNGSPLFYFESPDSEVVLASDSRCLPKFDNDWVYGEVPDFCIIVMSGEISFLCSDTNKKLDRLNTKPVIIKSLDVLDERFDSFMIKEIFDIPDAINSAFLQFQNNISKGLIPKLNDYNNVFLVGSGSAFYVAQIGQYLINKNININAIAETPEELLQKYYPRSGDLVISISQSGETYDTIETMKKLTPKGVKFFSICNNENGQIYNKAHYKIYQNCGFERCVLSTKSIISQCVILYMLSRVQNPSECSKEKNKLLEFSKTVSDLLNNKESLLGFSEQVSNFNHIFFIGRGIYSSVASESALKFKEVSYIHAEGMQSAMLKHGTIALIDESVATVVFLPNKEVNPSLYEYSYSAAMEIKARNGKVFCISNNINDDSQIVENNDFDFVVKLGCCDKDLDPFLQLVAGQLISYMGAKYLGRNVDKPRGLAKAVTVR